MKPNGVAVSLAACLAGVVLICGASACAPGLAHPARGSSPKTKPPSAIELPLDAYYPTAEQDLAIQRAEGELTARCMRRVDRTYTPPKPFHLDMVAARARLFGLVDEKEAQGYGYAGRIGPESKAEKKKQDPADEKALTKCFDDSSKRLEKGVEPISLTALDDLISGVGQQAEADERVEVKFTAWSACMKAKGLTFADPWKTNDDPRWQPGKPSALEKRTALADVQCKHSTGLLDTWYSVTVEFHHQAEKKYAAELARLTKATAARAANAMKVLGGS